MKYGWLMKGLFKDVDPQVVGEHIEALVEKYQERLTGDEILADAQKRNSPLHGMFEWNDTRAAERQRRQAASALMGSLVAKRGKQKTRAFVYVHVAGSRRKSYVPLRSAMGRTELREQVIKNAMRGLERWIDNYGGHRAFGFVRKDVERLRRKIEVEHLTAAGLA